MELLLTDLRLGSSRPGLPESAPQRAERADGRREAVPGAGREGSLQHGREGAAAALPQVQRGLSAPCLEIKKPLFDDCLVRSKSSLPDVCVWIVPRVTLSETLCLKDH